MLQWCHVHTLFTKISGGPTLKEYFLKSTPYTEYTIIVPPQEEFIWESFLLHSVTVSVSICVFLISPGRGLYVSIVDCCNHAQHTVNIANSHVNSIWLLEYFGHFHAPSRCTVQHVKRLFLGTTPQKLVDYVLKYKPDGYFTAEFGSWSRTILESNRSWGFDFILLLFFTKEALSRQELHWI